MFLASLGSVAVFHQKATAVNGGIIEGAYIVTLKPEASLEKSRGAVFAKGALDKIGFLYGNKEGSTFKGFFLKSSDVKLAIEIANMEDVIAIEPDQTAYALAVQTNPVWGLDRIDQTASTLDSLYYYKDSAAHA